jgi:hypothetical protein
MGSLAILYEDEFDSRKHLTEPLEPWTSSDPRTHEDSSPGWGAGMPETSSVISLTGQNHINNW